MDKEDVNDLLTCIHPRAFTNLIIAAGSTRHHFAGEPGAHGGHLYTESRREIRPEKGHSRTPRYTFGYLWTYGPNNINTHIMVAMRVFGVRQNIHV